MGAASRSNHVRSRGEHLLPCEVWRISCASVPEEGALRAQPAVGRATCATPTNWACYRLRRRYTVLSATGWRTVFVGAFKRDYLGDADLPDAETLLVCPNPDNSPRKEEEMEPFCERVLDAAVSGYQEVVRELRERSLLTSHRDHQGPGRVLNSVLQEFVIRFLILRKLYEGVREPTLKFSTEDHRIDLVLESSGRVYAFQLKRWQTTAEEKTIIENDVKALCDYPPGGADVSRYELVITINDNSGLTRNKDEAQYREDFNNSLIGKTLDLREAEFKMMDLGPGLTGCACLIAIDPFRARVSTGAL